MELQQVSKSISLSPADVPPGDVYALYVHVPFCFHKCHYCDFYSITRQSEDRMNRFVDLLLREAKMWADASPGLQIQPKTVFFGGGTPTLLPIDQMHRLISGLQTLFDFSQTNEWTVEANPATVTPEYCSMLRELGVNRMSLGAQSFHRAELAILERHHNPDDVPKSLEIARSAGFKRLNVDLIYAIPDQTLVAWQENLERAIDLKTEHISAYGLTYEPNTPMAVKKRLGHFRGVEESIELDMFHHTRSRLSACGFAPYEISNFAKPNEECRHNLIYWTGENYVGLGPSAASHVSGTRWKNRPHLGEWESAIASQKLPAADVEHLTSTQRAGELAMLVLRLSRGLIYDDYSASTGFNAREIFAEPIAKLSKLGLIESSPTGFCLSLAGLDIADSISAEFLDPQLPDAFDKVRT